ncbi:calcium/sodium antiporter [Thiovibrio sp. JS02]
MTQNFSSIWFAFLSLAGGLALLVCGGELLVAGAKRLARRLGMSSLLIGLTVVAFGTSMPEMFVSLAATLRQHPDIMIGNVVGSNIANVGLILGISALLLPLQVRFSLLAKDLYLLLAASFAVAAFSWSGHFTRLEGLVFMTVLLLYTVLSYRREARNKRENGTIGDGSVSLGRIVALILLGLIFLVIGSDLFIDGAVDIALYFKVSELVIGLTLAAVGTSLPELASSIAAVRQRETEILVGNVVGSNLFNLLMVMGATAALTPFALPSSLLARDLPVMIIFSAVLWPICAHWHGIRRWHGLGLLLGYGGYLCLLG